jgi:hypothetical protein
VYCAAAGAGFAAFGEVEPWGLQHVLCHGAQKVCTKGWWAGLRRLTKQCIRFVGEVTGGYTAN